MSYSVDQVRIKFIIDKLMSYDWDYDCLTFEELRDFILVLVERGEIIF